MLGGAYATVREAIFDRRSDATMTAPASKGWHAREGDPEGVLRWYDGRQWTPRVSGGAVQTELMRLQREYAANPTTSSHLQHRIRALEDQVARISEADGLGRGYSAPPTTLIGSRNHQETEALWATLRAPSPTPLPAQPRAQGRRWASRGLDAACYFITGIALVIFALAGPGGHSFIGVLAGAACIAYGYYIASTRRSYWVSVATYLVPVFGLLWILGNL